MQCYYTESEIAVIFIQFDILMRMKVVRMKVYKHCNITVSLWYGFTLIICREQSNIRIKAITTCANQAHYPDTVLDRKLFWLADVWYCCMQVIALKDKLWIEFFFIKKKKSLLLAHNSQKKSSVISTRVTCNHCAQSLLIHLSKHLFYLYKVNLHKK